MTSSRVELEKSFKNIQATWELYLLPIHARDYSRNVKHALDWIQILIL